MEAIRLNEFVTERGIYINNEQLKNFQNMKVEIIILPLEEKKVEKKIMKFAGILKEEDGEKLLQNVEECRTIDNEEW